MEEIKKQPIWKTILIWGAGICVVGIWLLMFAGISNALFSGAFKKKVTPPIQQELSENLETTQKEVEQEIYDLEKNKTLELHDYTKEEVTQDLQESQATLAELEAKIKELKVESEKKVDINYSNTDKKLAPDKKETEEETENATESASEQQKIQAANQLKADMTKYNSAMEMLQIDCEHQISSLESSEQNAINAEIGKQMAGGTANCDDVGTQCYIAVSKIKDSYAEQYKYIAAVCTSKWKALEATKYW